MAAYRVCLDTNIIISILTNNVGAHRPPEVWAGIKEIAADIDHGRCRLIVPTILFAELLPSHGHNIPLIELFFERRSVELRELTVKIATRAGQLRDLARLADGRALPTPDAIYIATAEIARVDVLYSADRNIFRAVGASVPLEEPRSRTMRLFPEGADEPPWDVV